MPQLNAVPAVGESKSGQSLKPAAKSPHSQEFSRTLKAEYHKLESSDAGRAAEAPEKAKKSPKEEETKTTSTVTVLPLANQEGQILPLEEKVAPQPEPPGLSSPGAPVSDSGSVPPAGLTAGVATVPGAGVTAVTGTEIVTAPGMEVIPVLRGGASPVAGEPIRSRSAEEATNSSLSEPVHPSSDTAFPIHQMPPSELVPAPTEGRPASDVQDPSGLKQPQAEAVLKQPQAEAVSPIPQTHLAAGDETVLQPEIEGAEGTQLGKNGSSDEKTTLSHNDLPLSDAKELKASGQKPAGKQEGLPASTPTIKKAKEYSAADPTLSKPAQENGAGRIEGRVSDQTEILHLGGSGELMADAGTKGGRDTNSPGQEAGAKPESRPEPKGDVRTPPVADSNPGLPLSVPSDQPRAAHGKADPSVTPQETSAPDVNPSSLLEASQRVLNQHRPDAGFGLPGQAGSSVPSHDPSAMSVARSTPPSLVTNAWEQVESGSIMSQLIDSARLISRKNDSELTISLKPEFLGRISLRAVLEDKVFVATIVAESPAVKHLLESQLGTLQHSLQEQGLPVSKVVVLQGSDLSHFGNGQQPGSQQGHEARHAYPSPSLTSQAELDRERLEWANPMTVPSPLYPSSSVNLIA